VTPDPLILTARFDEAAEAWLDALRRAHFPPERNVIPAHVTLFHALPGAELATITVVLEAEAGATPRSTARLGPPRSLGRGVALGVQAPGLAQLRARLAMRWVAWLGPQDRQGWRPHATVQNKVTPRCGARPARHAARRRRGAGSGPAPLALSGWPVGTRRGVRLPALTSAVPPAARALDHIRSDETIEARILLQPVGAQPGWARVSRRSRRQRAIAGPNQPKPRTCRHGGT
jgi:hypothetical protein